jgi:4-hydroxy-2-oxoheptanedioate aldolase
MSNTAEALRLGMFLGIPCPELAEMAAMSKLDFVVLDGEHGRIPPQGIHPLLLAAKAVNPDLAVYYRLPEPAPTAAAQAMDQAVDGIVIPQVSDAGQVQRIMQACRFAPLGERGVHPAVRAARYGLRDRDDYLTRANDETTIIAQVEGEAALAALPEILACPGLDSIFVGPYDLSQSLGVPGQVDHPQVVAALQSIAETASRLGKPFGTFAGNQAAATRASQFGYSFLAVSIDTLLISQAMRSLVNRFRAEE